MTPENWTLCEITVLSCKKENLIHRSKINAEDTPRNLDTREKLYPTSADLELHPRRLVLSKKFLHKLIFVGYPQLLFRFDKFEFLFLKLGTVIS